jgi:hypothetical protein
VAGNRRGGDGLDASATVGGSCVASRDAPNRGMLPSTSGAALGTDLGTVYRPSGSDTSPPAAARQAPSPEPRQAVTTCKHLATATTMFREMDMRFWLEQAEMEVKEVS